MKRCQFCRKKLKKKYHEYPSGFKKRKFCGYSCSTSYSNINLKRFWTKDKISKEFDKIKTIKKYDNSYIMKNHYKLGKAINRYYKKKHWCRFIYSKKKENRLISQKILKAS